MLCFPTLVGTPLPSSGSWSLRALSCLHFRIVRLMNNVLLFELLSLSLSVRSLLVQEQPILNVRAQTEDHRDLGAP